MSDFTCTGNGEDHCCYMFSEPCMFLGENVVPGRRWSCTLLVELGSWDAVHNDKRYKTLVQPVWDAVNERVGAVVLPSCGAWEPNGSQCCQAERGV